MCSAGSRHSSEVGGAEVEGLVEWRQGVRSVVHCKDVSCDGELGEGAKGAFWAEGSACAKTLWWGLERRARIPAWLEWSEPGRGVTRGEASLRLCFILPPQGKRSPFRTR